MHTFPLHDASKAEAPAKKGAALRSILFQEVPRWGDDKRHHRAKFKEILEPQSNFGNSAFWNFVDPGPIASAALR
jgi:hypothetical protein